jgi:trehalose/maltose hydrolase-like predicted phosphorylase
LVDRGPAIHEEGSGEWLMFWCWQRGIAPEQVLVVGDELDGLPEAVVGIAGGRVEFAAALEDQVARRRRGELPVLVQHPEWTLTVDGFDPLLKRVHESLLTLVDGSLGTRGSVLTEETREEAAVLMSGVYTRTGPEAHLLAGPRWTRIVVDGSSPRPVRRVLDLHRGVLQQEMRSEVGRIDSLMLSSLARPGTVALRVRDRGAGVRVSRPLAPPLGPTSEEGDQDGSAWIRVTGRPGSIVAAAADQRRGPASDRLLDRVGAYQGAARGVADECVALDRLREAQKLGFDGLLSEHRRAWAARWEDADVRIAGDSALQLAVRLAIFHLIASASDGGDAAVGARGMTGGAYRGHVFWDTDVYVIPALVATHPQAARSMLEYRVRRLPEAIDAARAQRGSGARFPWESAWSGQDVTPQQARDHRGELVPILTGELEEHIVADVAWAAACYIDWTGDEVFACGAGCELIVQTARWWASRIELDDDGRGHIRGVIGPDEYHERVDDNAYTNVMARWNLRRAAAASSGVLDARERHRWLELAEAIVDGYDPATGIYEQFAGFHGLEPLVIAEIAAQRPVDAVMLLGPERIQAAQVVKQPDVLMLHYLVPEEVAPGSLVPNLDYYEPRTSLGSTLAPGVHAALLARGGRIADAIQMLRLTARIDLDDTGGTTAGGLHLAAMGGVWKALSFGLVGLRPEGDALVIDPVLPLEWNALEVRVRFRGSRVRVKVQRGAFEATADPPALAVTPAGERVQLTPTPQTFSLSDAQPEGSP